MKSFYGEMLQTPLPEKPCGHSALSAVKSATTFIIQYLSGGHWVNYRHGDVFAIEFLDPKSASIVARDVFPSSIRCRVKSSTGEVFNLRSGS